MGGILNDLLMELGIHPVLVDIGASGRPPSIWDEIAQQSIYVGFDPDLRELHEVSEGKFFRSLIVNKAVISEKGGSQAVFYLTMSPYCSSTLRPDMDSLSNYLFYNLFVVEREATVPATTLDSIMEIFSLPRIHWFKTDSQGIDLRLFSNLPDEVRSHVLAVDIEPGLIDAYIGEDLFVDAHRYLTRNGFWLSDLKLGGSVRMRKLTLEKITCAYPNMNSAVIERAVRTSPAWCEARYLRTTEWLNQGGFAKEDYVLLWVFAVLDKQYGFALDLAVEYEKVWGNDSISQLMKGEPVARILQSEHKLRKLRTLFTTLKSIVPPPVRRWVKTHILYSAKSSRTGPLPEQGRVPGRGE